MSCKSLEPIPPFFYAPLSYGYKGEGYLGEYIYSPGFTFRYKVASAPCCRLYWNNGKAEPWAMESAYVKGEDGKWGRSRPNYLSYLLENGEYLTVRWETPIERKYYQQIKEQNQLAA